MPSSRHRTSPGRALSIALVFSLIGLLPSVVLAANADIATPSRQPAWRALLHMPAGVARSRVDTPGFFLAPEGKRDAAAEWQASWRAAQQPDEAPDRHFACRYPARMQLFRDRFADHDWPRPACPAYEAWRQRLNVSRATLVFASAYMGNPSSMFGHTLLRLDPPGAFNPLLSFVVNFAAHAQEGRGLAFAYKGLTGGYPGRFSIYAYYDKVAQYAQIEQRDLWEYPLALTEAELDRLLAHLWELREVEFDYWFLDENCSLQLLALLQVARPDIDLTGPFHFVAMPLDTVRQVQATEGLLGAPVFRPALATSVQAHLADLSSPTRRALRERDRADVITPDESLSAREQARVAELLHDLARLRMQAPRADVRHWRARAEAALDWRSRIDAAADFPAPRTPTAPDQAHASHRVWTGLRWPRGDVPAAVLGARLALHDELDPPAGMAAGSIISVLDVRLSQWRGDWRLDQAELIAIRSRPARDAFIKPLSWQLGVAYERETAVGAGFVEAEAGVGLSWARGTLLWGADALSSVRLDAHGRSLAAAGPALRATAHPAPRLGFHAELRWLDWHGGGPRDAPLVQGLTTLDLGLQWQLAPRWGLRLQLRRDFEPRADELVAGLLYYF